jgi:hypothetical protein
MAFVGGKFEGRGAALPPGFPVFWLNFRAIQLNAEMFQPVQPVRLELARRIL